MTRRLSPVLLALSALLPMAAHAAEWAIEPSVSSRANLTDNVNLLPGAHENVFNWSLSPAATFARRTEATELAGIASFGINRYPGNPDLDSDDATLSLRSAYHDERATYGLSASFVRDSTMASELATTGIVLTRQQRNLVSLAPSWNYALTQRSSVFAQYQYDQAKYQSGVGLTDYANQQASGGYQYLLSEQTAATVSANYSRYKAADGSILTDSYGIDVGLTHARTENLSFNLAFGVRRSDTTVTRTDFRCEFGNLALCFFFGIPLQPVTASSNTSDNGLTFKAGADYRWERSTASLALSRDINPSGTGTVVQTDRISITANHQFSEKLSGSAYGAYLISRYIGDLGADTEFSSLSSSLAWRLDEWWTLGTGYSFAYQKVKGAPESASSNTIFMSISYNWPKISISR